MKHLRFLKSFRYAFRGIVYCINNERNMRIHTVAALYVFAFSFFFPVSRLGYALLFLTFGSVMTAELFNTVSEELSDLTAASFNPVARIVKDMAAGAVLVCAIIALGVAVCLFWYPNVWAALPAFFLARPVLLALFVFSLFLSAAYIALGPLGIRDRLHRGRLELLRKTGREATKIK